MKKSWIWISVLTSMLLGGGYLAYRQTDVAIASDSLDREIALIERAGLTTDLRQLHPKSIAAEENGASYWYAALRAYHSSTPASPALLPKGSDLLSAPESELTNMRARLTDLKPAFDLLAKVTEKPHLVCDRNYEKGSEIPYPDLGPGRNLAKALTTKALLELREGHSEACYRDLRTTAKLAALLGEDQNRLVLHQRCHIEKLCLDALWSSLAWKQPNAADLDRAQTVLDSLGKLGDLRSILRTECAIKFDYLPWIMRYFDAIQRSDGPAVPYEKEWIMRLTSVQRANQAHVLEYFLRVNEALQASGADSEVAFPQIRAIDEDFDHRQGPGYLLPVTMSGYYLSNTEETLMEALARRRMTASALSILRQARKGVWPTEYISKARDPFSDQPFAYRRTAEGFTLYSVGKNRTDDNANPNLDDIAFRYPPLPNRNPKAAAPRSPIPGTDND